MAILFGQCLITLLIAIAIYFIIKVVRRIGYAPTQCLFGLFMAAILYFVVYLIAKISYSKTKVSNVILKTNVFELRHKTDRINKMREQLRPILTEHDFNRINIFDMRNHHTSNGVGYTINKQDVYVCTMKADGTPEDDEVIMYVLLHEVAHAICPDSVHHDQLFLQTFNTVLSKARSAGIQYREEKRICGSCVAAKNGGTCD